MIGIDLAFKIRNICLSSYTFFARFFRRYTLPTID